jgi:YHS domain-containing protein
VGQTHFYDVIFYNCKLQPLSMVPYISWNMFKDPVCNMMVDENKTKFVSESDGGRKVYLCSAACKSQFEANPAKYGY